MSGGSTGEGFDSTPLSALRGAVRRLLVLFPGQLNELYLERAGETACPVTTFYWDFLARHRERLEEVPRMGFALKNLDHLSEREPRAIRARAGRLRRQWGMEDRAPG